MVILVIVTQSPTAQRARGVSLRLFVSFSYDYYLRCLALSSEHSINRISSSVNLLSSNAEDRSAGPLGGFEASVNPSFLTHAENRRTHVCGNFRTVATLAVEFDEKGGSVRISRL
jgi:hypothetical protein